MANVPNVVPIEEMDDEIFQKHFELRHADWLGGLNGFQHHIGDDTLRCYRRYHEQLHRLLYGLFGIEEDHTHE